MGFLLFLAGSGAGAPLLLLPVGIVVSAAACNRTFSGGGGGCNELSS